MQVGKKLIDELKIDDKSYINRRNEYAIHANEIYSLLSECLTQFDPKDKDNKRLQTNLQSLRLQWHKLTLTTKQNLLLHCNEHKLIRNEFISSQNIFWEEQEKGLEILQKWLARSGSTRAQPLERLTEAVVQVLSKENKLGDHSRPFTVFSSLFLRIRTYNNTVSKLSDESKFASHSRIITTIEKSKEVLEEICKKTNNATPLELIELLDAIKCLLNGNKNRPSDLPLLLLKETNADGESLNQTLKINLLYPRYYLSLIDDIEENNPIMLSDSLENNINICPHEREKLTPLLNKLTAFEREKFRLEKLLSKKLDEGIETAAEELLLYNEWTAAKKKEFLSCYNDTIAALLESGKDVNKESECVKQAEEIFNIFEYITNCTKLSIFAPAFSIIKYGIQQSLIKKPATPPLTSTKRLNPLPLPSVATAQPIVEPLKDKEKKELPPKKSIDLIQGVSTAVQNAKKDLNGLDQRLKSIAEGNLNNIEVDFLPSIAEIADKDRYLQRLTEKTKLLLEQSLKFAVAKKDGMLLLEKTTGRVEQQRGVTHSLTELFNLIQKDFDDQSGEEMSKVLAYFSNPNLNGNERDFVGRALVICEAIVSKKSVVPVALAEPTKTLTITIEIPKEIKDAVTVFNLALEEKRAKVSQREQLYGQLVEILQTTESKREFMLREHFFSSCFDNMETAANRLQNAFDEVTEETPVAYSSELCHTSGLLLENTLRLHIAYHAIPGEEGTHKLFDRVISNTQVRTVRHVHNLKTLSDILRNHYADHYAEKASLFDAEMDQVLGKLETYNSNAHRYLAQDQTELGIAFRKLHQDTFWREGVSKEFEAFRKDHAHPILLNSLATARKLLEALPT
jgi:hypothetical protein